MDNQELLNHITVNPGIFGGIELCEFAPIIRGMRIKVENVLALLEQGVSQHEILEDYPDVEPEDIRARLAHARALVAAESRLRNESLEAVALEPVA